MSSQDTFIFIDTCSLLVSCWDFKRCGSNETFVPNRTKEQKFWDTLLPSLVTLGKVIVAKRNYEELVKLSAIRGDSERPMLAGRCKYVLERLRPLIENGSVSIVGDENDPFADAILLSAALKFRTQKNLLFITQDRALANDLVSLANFASVRPRGYQMKVRRLGSDGDVAKWRSTEIGEAGMTRSSKVYQPLVADACARPQREWWC